MHEHHEEIDKIGQRIVELRKQRQDLDAELEARKEELSELVSTGEVFNVVHDGYGYKINLATRKTRKVDEEALAKALADQPQKLRKVYSALNNTVLATMLETGELDGNDVYDCITFKISEPFIVVKPV